MHEWKMPIWNSQELVTVVGCFGKHDDSCEIWFEWGGVEMRFVAEDYFEAYKKVRIFFEKQGLIVALNCSRVNLYPSSVLRDMGKARKAYLLSMGVSVGRHDIVSIFDPADVKECGTVEAQEAFYREWIVSTK